MSATEQIRDIVRRLNHAWLIGRPDDIADLLHDNVVFVAPGFEARLEGRDACVQSFGDFVTQATVHDFETGDAQVDAFETSAVVTYSYEMEYTFDTKRWHGSGHDMLVLERHGDTWLIVWRMLLSGPEHEVDMTP